MTADQLIRMYVRIKVRVQPTNLYVYMYVRIDITVCHLEKYHIVRPLLTFYSIYEFVFSIFACLPSIENDSIISYWSIFFSFQNSDLKTSELKKSSKILQ